VHARTAGGNHDVGEFLFLDGFFQQVLAGVGTHVFVVGREGHTGPGTDFLRYAHDIDGSGYVLAAMANEYAYS